MSVHFMYLMYSLQDQSKVEFEILIKLLTLKRKLLQK